MPHIAFPPSDGNAEAEIYDPFAVTTHTKAIGYRFPCLLLKIVIRGGDSVLSVHLEAFCDYVSSWARSRVRRGPTMEFPPLAAALF
jgi:hypothetical protein